MKIILIAKKVDLKNLQSQSLVEYVGFKENIKELIYESSIVICPPTIEKGYQKF